MGALPGVDGREVVKDCWLPTDAFETRTLRGKPLRIRLSEDYAFCARAKRAGFEAVQPAVFCCPLGHSPLRGALANEVAFLLPWTWLTTTCRC